MPAAATCWAAAAPEWPRACIPSAAGTRERAQVGGQEAGQGGRAGGAEARHRSGHAAAQDEKPQNAAQARHNSTWSTHQAASPHDKPHLATAMATPSTCQPDFPLHTWPPAAVGIITVPVSAALASAVILPGAPPPPLPSSTSSLPLPTAAAAGLQGSAKRAAGTEMQGSAKPAHRCEHVSSQPARKVPAKPRWGLRPAAGCNANKPCSTQKHHPPLRRYRIDELGGVRLAVCCRRRRCCCATGLAACRPAAPRPRCLTCLEALDRAILIPHLLCMGDIAAATGMLLMECRAGNGSSSGSVDSDSSQRQKQMSLRLLHAPGHTLQAILTFCASSSSGTFWPWLPTNRSCVRLQNRGAKRQRQASMCCSPSGQGAAAASHRRSVVLL